MMTKATPEGARDFLVPSRISRGSFYALPQSPQLFKQLLMASGFEKYYQIVRCFRDEDTRADRQPEFTQLDIEKAFTDEDEIINLSEKLIKFVFKKLLEIKLPKFPKMTYSEAIERFGSDKPDLRINLELKEVKEIFLSSDFKVFSGPANDLNSRVVALKISSELTRSKIDSYTEFVGKFGAKGLAYIKVNDLSKGNDGLQSPILKFLSQKEINSLFKFLDVKDGDTVFFGAGHRKIVSDSMGALRNKIAEDFDLIEESWKPVWITNWPLFEESIGGDLSPAHHPFTSFKGSIEDLEADPRAVEANAYDLVINGTEVGGGSIRIHKSSEQAKVLEVLGISENEAQNKFGFFLDALNYGFPPHGGIAFGLDRLVMLMMGADSIRSVIPFPKTQSALCLLTDAPARVDSEQLEELGISLTDPDGD
jgi:aspartyl-tRNA synthetase